MFKIKVPATTANIGAGFDCLGMALSLYNEITVKESDRFSIEIKGTGAAGGVFTTKDNLIYQVIASFYEEIGQKVPHLAITQDDCIPMTRGLGSSSACIVAGLFAANELTGRPMTRDKLAQMACQIEGHPDNVAPAVYGGLIVAVLEGEAQILHHVKITPPSELSYVAFIPNFQLSTAKARRILPLAYPRADAVFNISRASLFIASMMNGDFSNFHVALNDRIHQPYRGILIPGFDAVFEAAETAGAHGVFMSGAGPTIIAITTRNQEETFAQEMQNALKDLDNDWETIILHADLEGATVCAM